MMFEPPSRSEDGDAMIGVPTKNDNKNSKNNRNSSDSK